MRMIRSNCGRRQAFSLIELITVIAIIAILAALSAGAAMKLWGKGPEAVCRSEITALSTAMGTFKQEFNVTHLPSKFVLYDDLTKYGNTQLETDSKAFLQQMFGMRIGVQANTNPPKPLILNWSGNGPGTVRGITLTGDQCLVFFLGGIPTPTGTTPGCQGFGSNPSDPTDLTAANGGTRRGPFYPDFKANRLQVKALNGTGGNGFFVYLDPFAVGGTSAPIAKQSQYAYFSAYKSMNGYNRYKANGQVPATGQSAMSDCPLTNFVAVPANAAFTSLVPYYQTSSAGTPPIPPAGSTTNYVNPTSFQIISAGADGQFGPGGHWDPSTGYALPPVYVGPAGKIGSGGDDMSNFSRTVLGQPQS